MCIGRRKGIRANSRYLTYLGLALPAWHAGGRDAAALLRILASGIPLAPASLLVGRVRSRVRFRSGVVLHYRSCRFTGEANCGGMAGRALTGLFSRDINQLAVDMAGCRGPGLYLAGSTWLAKDREAGAITSESASHWAGDECLRDRAASLRYLAISSPLIGWLFGPYLETLLSRANASMTAAEAR